MRTKDGKLSPEYHAWANMLSRCRNNNRPDFKHYGGRGIKVCDEWKVYSVFLAAMGRRPSPSHSLDRFPDPNGDYRPGNCRWATKKEQANNTRQVRWLTAFGATLPLRAMADKMGINYGTLKSRLGRGGFSIEKALTAPLQTNEERASVLRLAMPASLATRQKKYLEAHKNGV
jgi:hypothetical protein